MSLIARFLRDERGATAIEYGLIAAGISVAIIATVAGLGSKLNIDLHHGQERAELDAAARLTGARIGFTSAAAPATAEVNGISGPAITKPQRARR